MKSSPDLEHTEVNGHSKNLLTDQVLPGRFLDVESLCELLKNETVTVSTIPKGVKENVYFVVSNGKNIAKRNRGEKSNFEDDSNLPSNVNDTGILVDFMMLQQVIQFKQPLTCFLKNTNFLRNARQPTKFFRQLVERR